MTEAEWLKCKQPEEMLRFWANKGSVRKWRLVVFSICRSIWHLLTDEGSRSAIVIAEQAVGDDAASRLRMLKASIDATTAATEFGNSDPSKLAAASAVVAALCAGTDAVSEYHVEAVFRYATRATSKTTSDPYQAALIRDIFGNPFHPVTADPTWLSPDVLALARAIYSENAFDRLPILADALEEAGCDNADVLNHCRGPGPHVRGCWAVDMILGKQ